MKKALASALLVFLSLVLVACATPVAAKEIKSDKPRSASPQVPASDVTALVNGNDQFALDLYQQLKSGDGNLFYSPYSISLMLSMASVGARGATQQQMADALRFKLTQDKLHPAFDFLSLELAKRASSDSTFKLNVVNDIWGQKDYSFLAPFLDTLAQNYGAGLRVLDFRGNPETARTTINDYIYSQTQKLIKDLIPSGSITTLTRLVLTNAIYFKADWEHQFNKNDTRDGVFNLLDGTTVIVPMMSQRESWNYAEGDSWQALEMPYKGGQIAMDIILPVGSQFKAFESSLNADKVSEIINSMQSQVIQLTIPKFKFGSEFSLKQSLSTLGITDAFDPNRADFSGITDSEQLYISDALHKAYVSVDEQGTEAAAAGAVVIGATFMPKSFTADHPFIFLIRDVSTNTILFLGRVMNPNAQ